jgi:hypothetical protein
VEFSHGGRNFYHQLHKKPWFESSSVEAEFGDILYYTEVMWLSRGNALRRFFNLKAEVEIFINKKSKSVPELSDAEWILDLAFLVDITSFLNELNTKLQEKGKLLSDIFSDIFSLSFQ